MISNYNYRPLFYFSMTFFSTYILWFAGAYVSFQEDTSSKYMLFMLSGLVAPFFISAIMIWKSQNPAVQKDFINRLIDPRRIRLKMIPVFFLIMPFLKLLNR